MEAGMTGIEGRMFLAGAGSGDPEPLAPKAPRWPETAKEIFNRPVFRITRPQAPPALPSAPAPGQPGACRVERAAYSPKRGAVIALMLCPLGAASGEPPDARQAELLHMLRHDCGACHGLRLDGGLGPPLTAEVLSGVAPAALVHIILEGRPGTPMPPWKALLSPGEVRWMVRAMQTGRVGQ